MINTVNEAIKICQRTYPGRIYTIRDLDTGEIITGSAYKIYTMLLDKKSKNPRTGGFFPVDETCIEDYALLIVIDETFSNPVNYLESNIRARELILEIITNAKED